MRNLFLDAMMTMVLLAACDREGGNRSANQAAAGLSNRERLQEMTDGQRNAVFIRAIREAGFNCQHVAGSQTEADYRGRPVWNVRCDGGGGGGNWTMVIDEQGVAQIIDANEFELDRKGPVGSSQPLQRFLR